MTRFYCPACKLTLEEGETLLDIEYVTSEFWGMRTTEKHQYRVCGHCGADVEPAPLAA